MTALFFCLHPSQQHMPWAQKNIVEGFRTKFLLGRKWQYFEELREHMRSFKPSSGWAFCQGLDQSAIIPAKIQGLPAQTGELQNNRLTMMLCPAKVHGLLSWSSTTGHTPWLLISTAAESTERPLSSQRVMHCRSAGLSWAFTQLKFKCLHLCVRKAQKLVQKRNYYFYGQSWAEDLRKKKADQPKHQVLVFSPKISDPRFLPQCMLLTQSFFIYIKHCWAHFFAIKS